MIRFRSLKELSRYSPENGLQRGQGERKETYQGAEGGLDQTGGS